MSSIQPRRAARPHARPRKAEEVARLVAFPRAWRDVRLIYCALRCLALALAGWGLWYRSSHGLGLDPVTLDAMIGMLAFGLLPPSVLRDVVNWGAPVSVRLIAASTPAPSERAEIRAAEVHALALLATTYAISARVAQDRARTIVARVLAVLAAVAIMIQPRLVASQVVAYAASSAA